MSTYFKIKGYKSVTADLEQKRDPEVSFVLTHSYKFF